MQKFDDLDRSIQQVKLILESKEQEEGKYIEGKYVEGKYVEENKSTINDIKYEEDKIFTPKPERPPRPFPGPENRSSMVHSEKTSKRSSLSSTLNRQVDLPSEGEGGKGLRKQSKSSSKSIYCCTVYEKFANFS